MHIEGIKSIDGADGIPLKHNVQVEWIFLVSIFEEVHRLIFLQGLAVLLEVFESNRIVLCVVVEQELSFEYMSSIIFHPRPVERCYKGVGASLVIVKCIPYYIDRLNIRVINVSMVEVPVILDTAIRLVQE